MSTSDKLNLRMSFENGTNSNISIPDYKVGSATNANLQTLADAAKDVLETDEGSAFTGITNVERVETSETTLNATAGAPIYPSGD